MTDSVDLKFTYTRDDIARALFIAYGARNRMYFDATLAILLLPFGLWMRAEGGWTYWIGIAAIVASLLFLAMILFYRFVTPILIMRSSPRYRDEYRLSFSDEGIRFETETINSTLQWPMYFRAIGTPDFWLLYHGRRAYTIIPARTFANPEDRQRFEALVTAHVPNIERR